MAQPDLVYVCARRLDIVTAQAIQGAPDLVAEVLSPSTAPTDRGLKMTTYARAGVQEYWLVDPDQRTVGQYVLEGDTFRPAARVTGNRSLTSALLGGLPVDLSAVWE